MYVLKQDLKEQGEQKVNSEKSLKHKAKCEVLKNVKRQFKTDFQNTIDDLRKSFESEPLKADKEQNVRGCFIFEVCHGERKYLERS